MPATVSLYRYCRGGESVAIDSPPSPPPNASKIVSSEGRVHIILYSLIVEWQNSLPENPSGSSGRGKGCWWEVHRFGDTVRERRIVTIIWNGVRRRNHLLVTVVTEKGGGGGLWGGGTIILIF